MLKSTLTSARKKYSDNNINVIFSCLIFMITVCFSIIFFFLRFDFVTHVCLLYFVKHLFIFELQIKDIFLVVLNALLMIKINTNLLGLCTIERERSSKYILVCIEGHHKSLIEQFGRLSKAMLSHCMSSLLVSNQFNIGLQLSRIMPWFNGSVQHNVNKHNCLRGKNICVVRVNSLWLVE